MRASSHAVRHRPPRARALATPTASSTRGSRLAPRRAARRPLVARLPARSRELAAKHVTVALSGQGADELLGGYRKHRAAALVGAVEPAAAAAAAAGARDMPSRAQPRFDRLARTLAAPRIPSTRLLAMSGDLDDGLRERARPRRRSPSSTDERSLRAVQRRSTPIADEPLAGDALPRRPARARRRHAPLLRPDVDGPLARGARPVPRPPRRRVLRTDPDRAQGPRGSTRSTC